MIKNIFLPDQFGSYYLFAKRILGIHIGKISIHATVLYARGNSITIEQCIEIPFDGLEATDTVERTGKALTQLMEQVGSVQEIHSAIASSVVVFKELRIPFASYEKIALIVPFEVEPLLPFSLTDAVVDFIITQVDQENHAHILVAAVQKTHIAQHLELLAQAGINPARISIDLLDLYSLYRAIPAYAQGNSSTALIAMNVQDTTIAYLDAGQLRFIRTLPKGTLQLAKLVADALSITPAQAMEHIMRFGVQDTDWPEYAQAIKQALNSFLENIQFTLSSFAAQASPQTPLQSLQLLGSGATIKGIAPYAQEQMKINVTLFDLQAISTIPHVLLKSGLSITMDALMSTAIALPTPIAASFNLRKNEFEITNPVALYKQLAVVGTLSLLALICIGTYSYLQLSALQTEVTESEQEAITTVTERFKNLETEGGNLDDILDNAEQALKKDKKTWSVFSGQSRISYLRYLAELTRILDRQALGLVVDKITFVDNLLILKGYVKGYDELKMLLQELRQSKLFIHVEKENNTHFDALKITLAHGSSRE
jgi:type IV pilus assembly protein PilM